MADKKISELPEILEADLTVDDFVPIVSSPGLVTSQVKASAIVSKFQTGEINTASNVGAGEGVFKQKTSLDLEFLSLEAGAGISVTPGADTLVIASTGTVVTPFKEESGGTLTGAVDGTNPVFTATHTPIAATLFVFWNGLLQPPSEYTLVGAVVTLGSNPETGDKIVLYYSY